MQRSSSKKGKTLKFLSRAGITALYSFLYLPIAVLFAFSFNDAKFPAPWKSFTFHWYKDLFLDQQIWHAFKTSLIVAICTATLTIVLGLAFIYWLSNKLTNKNYVSLFYGNIVIPETVMAVSLLGIFTFFDIPLGLLTLISAHTILGLGFAVPILFLKYADINPKLFEASLDLGATPIITYTRIAIPLLRPSIIATGLITFILSFDDFIFSYFVAGSTTQTLPLFLLNQLRSGLSPSINALAIFLFMLSTLFVICYIVLRKRTRI